MIDLSYSRCAGLRGPFRSGLLFLFHLAWKSRLRLPFLIAIGFMVLDIRMQLVIDIDLGRAGRQGIPILGQGNEELDNEINDDTDSDLTLAIEDDESSEDSYITDTYSLNSESSIDSNEDLNVCEDNKHISGVNENSNTNQECPAQR